MPYREIKENRIRRFHRRIQKDPESGCWNWTGYTTGNGYGQAHYGGGLTTAHRAYWLCAVGDLPDDLDLDHLCRNRTCVNPDHLEPVTRSENLERGYEARGCKNGHPYTEDGFSVVTRSDGRTFRRCKACHRERNRKSKTRRSKGLRAERDGSSRMITFQGESMCMEDWARRLGITAMGLRWRLDNWPIERALTERSNAA